MPKSELAFANPGYLRNDQCSPLRVSEMSHNHVADDPKDNSRM